MNANISTKVVTIHDLRTIGSRGGATARLDNGEELILEKDYGLIRRQGVINGKLQTVEIIERYPSIYSKIRTIKWNSILVARKVMRKGKIFLELTGKGYRRNQ